MAAENGLRFDDNFVDLPGVGDASQPAAILTTSPTNPLYELIDSGRYIQSLENKLKKLKGGKQKEPTAKEMIKSLAVSKEAHFRHVDIERESYCSNFVSASSDIDKSYSVLQRKIHPDRVAIDAEELVELLHDNEVEKRAESDRIPLQSSIATSSTVSNSTTRSIVTTTQSHMPPTSSNSNTASESNSLTSSVKTVEKSSVKSKTSNVSNVVVCEEKIGQTEEQHIQVNSLKDVQSLESNDSPGKT